MKKRLIQRNDSTVRYPYMDDTALLALESKEVHIPSDIGDIVVVNNDVWDIIDMKIDADMAEKSAP